MTVDYNTIASDYQNYRKPDSRIASAISRHLQQATTVLNVGAGMGGYEPEGCEAVALEPSAEMVAKRPKSAAQAVRGVAEALPFADNTFDVSMGVLTMHHWSDLGRGLQEMQRVSRDKVVLLTWDGQYRNFWLLDYLPQIADMDQALFLAITDVVEALGGAEVDVVEVPHDCTDGFMCAYWRRPEYYLNEEARRAISTFSRLGDLSDGLRRLRADLDSGSWFRKYNDLLSKSSLDLGYRLVVHESRVSG